MVSTYVLGFAMAGVGGAETLTDPASGSTRATPAATSAFPLLASLGTEALVFAYFIARSQLKGWPLIVVVFLAFYGTSTIGLHVESLVFLRDRMTVETIGRMFVAGAIAGLLFSVVAVAVMGRLRGGAVSLQHPKGRFSVAGWGWRLGIAGVCFTVLYLVFGYYVAWRQPVIQDYYGGTDPGSFAGQLGDIWRRTPWFFPFQFGRGLLYIVCILPLLRSLSGRRWEHALAFAILFAGWILLLLVPNPYMPKDVAMIHLRETAPWNFLFGALVGWLFSPSTSRVPRVECLSQPVSAS